MDVSVLLKIHNFGIILLNIEKVIHYRKRFKAFNTALVFHPKNDPGGGIQYFDGIYHHKFMCDIFFNG
jgi:hypothetical protein